MFRCSFKIKKNKIPTIQIRNNRYYFRPNDYLESSEGNVVTLTLTNIDLKLFFEQYDVEQRDLNFICGWKFKGIKGLFTKYIDYWIGIKNEATLTGNKPFRTISKLMLNSLYGKFSTSMDTQSKIPYIRL